MLCNFESFPKVLTESKCEVERSWPLVGQFSSIGSLGSRPTQWLTTEWSSSLAGHGARGIRLVGHFINTCLNPKLKKIFIFQVIYIA